MQVEGEAGFVLHTREYRESSQLVDLFTRHHGRLRVVARGVRSGKTGRGQKLFPFTPLQLAWRGRGELKNLVSSEPLAVPALLQLQGEKLYSGFYLNELLLRLLAEHDPHEHLFDCYRQTVAALEAGEPLEKILRLFELKLLQEIGYGLVLDYDARTGDAIRNQAWYWFDQQQGLVQRQLPPGMEGKGSWFYGEHLLAMSAGTMDTTPVLKDAKRLLRQAIQPHLGGRPLRSRELFRSYVK